jgi:hypothetical protein
MDAVAPVSRLAAALPLLSRPILDAQFRNKVAARVDAGRLLELLVEIGVVVMMVMVVVMMANDDHDLRLRRIRSCEAEDESECKQDFFHSPQYGGLRICLQSSSDR